VCQAAIFLTGKQFDEQGNISSSPSFTDEFRVQRETGLKLGTNLHKKLFYSAK